MKRLTPIKAIRAKCLDCSYGQAQEVRLCPLKKCPLYPYRMGRRPKDGEIIDECGEDEKAEDSPDFFEQEGHE